MTVKELFGKCVLAGGGESHDFLIRIDFDIYSFIDNFQFLIVFPYWVVSRDMHVIVLGSTAVLEY